MTQDTAAFFTLDRGTSTTAAALVAPVEGRYRLVAAGSAPADVDPDDLLEDLAWRVARTDAAIAGPLDGWQGWARLEVGTLPAPTATLVAAAEESGRRLEQAFSEAGWGIHATVFGRDRSVIELGEACLAGVVDAIVVAAPADPGEGEAEALRHLWPRCGSIARLRDDVALIAAGNVAERPDGIPDARLFALPAPQAVAPGQETPLRDAARQVAGHVRRDGRSVAADGRQALRVTIASLAAVLGTSVGGLSIGAAAGSVTDASPSGETAHVVRADGALLPPSVMRDGDTIEAILRWSAVRGDPTTLSDRLRELRLRPWAGLDGQAVGLRLAAARAALERIAGAVGIDAPAPGVIVLGGGVFSVLPPAAAALAVADAVRRPGPSTILHDHAGLLAPLGALPVEEDRRRLLGDLMDDVLVPLGSTLLVGRERRRPPADSLAIGTLFGDQLVRLADDEVRFVDLPPGIDGRVRVERRDDPASADGPPSPIEVRGGLGGLLVDTRPIPLELPTSTEPRRRSLAAWEAPALAGTDR